MSVSTTVSQPTLADLLPGRADLAGATAVSGLCLDSRRCVPGDVFLAVRGASSDGRRYIPEALAQGCVAVIAEAVEAGSDSGAEIGGDDQSNVGVVDAPVPLLRIEHLEREVSAIAGRFYGNPGESLRITAVTGTNGKTSCSYLLAQLLTLLGDRAGIIGTLGYGLVNSELIATGMTTPDAVETQRILAGFVEQEATVATIEVSSHSLDQHRVAALPFDTAVFTNLSRDHLDYHGTLEAYGAAKARLFAWPGLRHAVINVDDSFGRQVLAGLPAGVNGVGYSVVAKAAVSASDIAYTHEGVSALVDTPWGRGVLTSPLLGEFNLANLLAVVAAACVQGHSLDAVLASVPDLRPVAGRMEVVSTGSAVSSASTGANPGGHPQKASASSAQPQVVVDYAHSPDALEKSLIALRRHCRGQLWCVFGCGGDRDGGKRPLMGAIAAQLADRVLVTSDNPRSESPEAIIADIVVGIPAGTDLVVEIDRRSAIRRAILSAGGNDTVLIAGKGHEDYQQVGSERLPFSDQAEARLALHQRGGTVQ